MSAQTETVPAGRALPNRERLRRLLRDRPLIPLTGLLVVRWC